MQHSSFIPLTSGAIRINQFTLRPWPKFQTEGDMLQCSEAVSSLLTSDDPFAMIWRGTIPDPILKALLYLQPGRLSVAMELAHSNPVRFVDWAGWCPALLDILCGWGTDLTDPIKPTVEDLISMFARDWKTVLAAVNLPPTRAFLRILHKIPAGVLTTERIKQLAECWREKRLHKLLSHLDQIDDDTFDLLSLPHDFLDVHLLNLKVAGPYEAEVASIAQVCRNIANYRQTLKKFPIWPYRGKKPSIRRLLSAQCRLQFQLTMGRNCHQYRLPPPPVSGISSSRMRVEPLSSLKAMFAESSRMDNCVESYGRQVISGTHYAYKMHHPERATILLIRRGEDWYPAQVRTFRNGYATPETLDIINTWLGVSNGKEVNDDGFPF